MSWPERVTFSGHETFTFRYGWLKKGVEAALEDPGIFNREDATTRLGVGKNMVKSIRHWCLSLGLIEESGTGLRVSEWGRTLLLDEDKKGRKALDPYLEDPASLWFLHWNLVSRMDSPTTWYFAFNKLKGFEFSKRQVVQALTHVCDVHGNGRSTANTIKRDVDCFIRTYVGSPGRGKVLEESLDCPLVELDLLHALEDGETFRFASRPNGTLTDGVLAWCIADYWNRRRDRQGTLPVEEICYGEGAPGRAFRLSESDLLNRVERIGRTWPQYFQFVDTAGLKQLMRHKPLEEALQVLLRDAFLSLRDEDALEQAA